MKKRTKGAASVLPGCKYNVKSAIDSTVLACTQLKPVSAAPSRHRRKSTPQKLKLLLLRLAILRETSKLAELYLLLLFMFQWIRMTSARSTAKCYFFSLNLKKYFSPFCLEVFLHIFIKVTYCLYHSLMSPWESNHLRVKRATTQHKREWNNTMPRHTKRLLN